MRKKELNTNLPQKSIFYGESHNFEIYNQKFIKIISNRLFGKQSYHLNLSMLAPWPVQNNVISWPAILTLLLLYLFSLVFFYNIPLQLKPTVLFSANTVIFLATFLFIYKSKKIFEFKSRYGDCVVLSLLYDKPNKRVVKKFIDEIKLRSLTASQEMEMDITQMLDIEANELRRLKNEKIISSQSYDAAKKRIDKMIISKPFKQKAVT